jgi:hypothetical protein
MITIKIEADIGGYPLYNIGINKNIIQVNVKTRPNTDLNPFLPPIMQREAKNIRINMYWVVAL